MTIEGADVIEFDEKVVGAHKIFSDIEIGRGAEI